jgi:hypothetical protein
MNIWEFLKFLAMLIPTWLLLAALALTLSLPSNGGGAPPSVESAAPHSEDVVIADSEFGPLQTVIAR